MPFKSYAQTAYLKHNEPAVYRRWARKYGKPKGGLPQHVKAARDGYKKV